MLDGVVDKPFDEIEFLELVKSDLVGFVILDSDGQLKQTGGRMEHDREWANNLCNSLTILKKHQDKQEIGGAFYRHPGLPLYSEIGNSNHTIFIEKIPNSGDTICIVYDLKSPIQDIKNYKSELVILSLISQAVRAFNQAENLETILKLVLIGVTAGGGLGFNRAFILLTCDDQCCLRGALANGPSSPEDAHQIWSKLSSGEITLEEMFNNVLDNKLEGTEPLNGFLRNIVISLADKNNIFAKAALEKKSMIIDETTLASAEYSDLHSMIGPGPLAIVPLIGHDYLQGVLIADNCFISLFQILNFFLKILI